MKSFLSLLLLVSFGAVANVNIVDFHSAEKSYNEAVIPDFGPWIGVAISGRCFFRDSIEKKTPSVLLPANSEDGLMIAPVTADKHSENFFDKMTYEQIVTRFPKVNLLFRAVSFNEHEAILVKREGQDLYEAQIRESQEYFLVKILLKAKAVRYCFYKKEY